jgi:hypothetical protein
VLSIKKYEGKTTQWQKFMQKKILPQAIGEYNHNKPSSCTLRLETINIYMIG